MSAAQTLASPIPLAAPATRPRLRVLRMPRSAPLPPFVGLIAALLIVGLTGLLLLNTSLARNSFRLTELRNQVAALEDRQATLTQEAATLDSPDALAQRAQALGMVPGATPVFIDPNTGTVIGAPPQPPKKKR